MKPRHLLYLPPILILAVLVCAGIVQALSR